MQIPKNVLIAIGVGLLVLVIGLPVLNWSLGNSVHNTGNKKEATLNAQYKINKNTLGDCEVRTEQAANIATATSANFDKIISDAVKGRYTQGSSATGAIDSGKLFSALQEAYPNVTSVTAVFSKVLDVANGCRTDYRDQQSKMQDMIRDFDSWRTGSWTVRHYGNGFPNNNLEADNATGLAAEKKMKIILVPSNTAKEYQDGTLQPTDPFPTTTSG